MEEWEEWREAVRVNMRKPLGMDFAKRRYWSIGGQAACWRVYVEEEEGTLWGWYEGHKFGPIFFLLAPFWLKGMPLLQPSALPLHIIIPNFGFLNLAR